MFFVPLFSGCSQQIESKQLLFAFGTEVHLQMLANSEETVQKTTREIEDYFQAFNQVWHAWKEDSSLSQINRAIRQQKPIVVTDEVKQFIVMSQRLSHESNGLFDPAIGQLVNLWGFHSEDWAGEPPPKEKIENYLANPASIQQVSFDGNQLQSSNSQVQLDFGGNVKGLALKRAAEIMQKNGIHNGIINIGGDMLVLGSKNDQAWRIGVQDPKTPQRVIAQIQARDGMAVVTSGTYQRFFEWQGKTYSHLLNPNTGYPAETFASVTILHEDPTRADADATAILIAGKSNWESVAQQMAIRHVLAIDQQGNFIVSDDMKRVLKRLN